MKLTYNDYKKKVSIIDVLVYLGYKYDKSKGKSRPNFVLRNHKGEDIDRVIITNPEDSEHQGYWRRNGSSGDLITFIKENLNSFRVHGNNDIDRINKVLRDFANEPHEDYNSQDFLDKNGIKKAEPFNLKRYTMLNVKGAERATDFLFKTRGIDRDTVAAFADHIYLVMDKEAKFKFKNIGFAYTTPGSDEICGFEIRGHASFKGKATGTNSTLGLWIADLSEGGPMNVKHIYFGESALDIMAFYQRNKATLDVKSSVFASLGGSFSDQQVLGMLEYYKDAKGFDCFDNDLAGKIFGLRLMMLAQGEKLNAIVNDATGEVTFTIGNDSFNIPIAEVGIPALSNHHPVHYKAGACKPPVNYKDWNDVVLNKPMSPQKL